jgi:hypothetical protein
MVMMCQCKNRKIIFALVALIFMVVCAVQVCFAGNDEVTSVNKTTASQIKEIPGMDSEGNRNFTGELEKKYDFIGTVDNVQEEGIVIGDSFFKKAPNANMSGASAGTRVGIMLNKEGQVVLCEPFKKVSK